MKIFDKVRVNKPKRSKFNLSHERKQTQNMADLVPMYLEEILPGDSFKVKSEILIRFAPLIAPIMHRVDVYTHYFFVPNRIIWDNFEDFMTGGRNGDLEPVYPTMTLNASDAELFAGGTTADYLGVPSPQIQPTVDQIVSSLPFRAYLEIYNEYYRDQNLSDAVPYSKGDGTASGTDKAEYYKLRKRSWEKDYLTSAMPWAQRGGEAQIPLGQVSPVYKPSSDFLEDTGAIPAGGLIPQTDGTGKAQYGAAGLDVRIENLEDSLDVDATSIRDLRKAFKVQEWLEKAARMGSRYKEQTLAFFGVHTGDARLDRPEYLGGGKQNIVVSEVLNQAGAQEPATLELQAVGEMAGHAISVGGVNGFSKSFTEHGYVIGIMSVLPRTAYQDGLARTWSRRDKFDYPFPEFAHIGEQEILNKEVFLNFTDKTLDNNTWGYQMRYSEYKFHNDSVHGLFKGDFSYWHLGRQFTALPALNEAFVTAENDTRIYAILDNQVHHLYVQIYHKISAIRPLPYFSDPKL